MLRNALTSTIGLAFAMTMALPLTAQQATDTQESPSATDSAATSAGSTTTDDSSTAGNQSPSGLIRGTSLLDGSVYAAETAGGDGWEVGEPLLDVPAEWSQIGEIEDLALTPEGQLEGLVVEIGGFLGIGRTVVLVDAKDLRSVRVGDDVYFLTDMTEAQLKELPHVDETMWE